MVVKIDYKLSSLDTVVKFCFILQILGIEFAEEYVFLSGS